MKANEPPLVGVPVIAPVVPSSERPPGKAPEVTANMATVEFGSENKAIEVPTVTTTTKTISVPTLRVNKPTGADGNSVTTQ